jgi:hypothetical protein
MDVTTGRPAATIGFQAGLNFENADSPSQISANSRTGFSAGALVNIPLNQALSIQPELNYSRRSFNLASAGDASADVLYHSLELPVFVKVGFGEAIRPTIFAGPMAVWNVSREVRGSFGSATTTSSFSLKTLDFAAVAGVGLDIGAFFVNARYALGVTDISQNSAGYYSRGFKLMAGVNI